MGDKGKTTLHSKVETDHIKVFFMTITFNSLRNFGPWQLFIEVNCLYISVFEVLFANEEHEKLLLKPKSMERLLSLAVCCGLLFLLPRRKHGFHPCLDEAFLSS